MSLYYGRFGDLGEWYESSGKPRTLSRWDSAAGAVVKSGDFMSPAVLDAFHKTGKWPAYFYDLAHPPIAAGTAGFDAFIGAMHVFWPDLVFDPDTGRDTVSHSLASSAPFPYWLPVLSPKQVDFAVAYLQDPNSFGAPGVKQSVDYAGTLGKGALTGASIGAALGGGTPLGIAIGTAAGTILGAFEAFSGNDPNPPGWYKTLSGIRDPRLGYGRFYLWADTLTVAGQPAGGLSLLDAYAQVLNRVAQAKAQAAGGSLPGMSPLGRVPLVGWIALGVGAALLLGD